MHRKCQKGKQKVVVYQFFPQLEDPKSLLNEKNPPKLLRKKLNII